MGARFKEASCKKTFNVATTEYANIYIGWQRYNI